MSTINRLLAACLVAAVFAPAPAQAATHSFEHDFDNYDAIWWTLGQSRSTFANFTTYGSNGLPAACPASFTYDGSCWQYAPLTWDTNNYYWSYFFSWGSSNHYHLSFEDPAFNTTPSCFVDPGDGYGAGMVKRINGVCNTQAIDWAAQKRELAGMLKSDWVVMGLQNANTGEWRTFDIDYVVNAGTAPLQVWGMDQNGAWWFYPSLAGPGLWTFPAGNALEEWEFYIGVADAYTGPGSFRVSSVGQSIRDH